MIESFRQTLLSAALPVLLVLGTAVGAKEPGKGKPGVGMNFIEGTWEVVRHDYRDFRLNNEPVPEDIETLIAREERGTEGVLPVGQRLRIKRLGPTALQGAVSPETMKVNGPVGEGLALTFLAPLHPKLCALPAWSYLCKIKEGTPRELVVVWVEKWDGQKGMNPLPSDWPDVVPMTFAMTSVDKLITMSAWKARDGSLVFESTVLVGPNGQEVYRRIATWLRQL